MKQEDFNTQLQMSGCREFLALLKRTTKKKIVEKRRLKELDEQRNTKLARLFMSQTLLESDRRAKFVKCFLSIFVYHHYYSYARDAFSDIKKYHRYKEIHLLGKDTTRIQLLIEAFEKKRKIVVGEALRKWRKYEYIRNMKVNLMRRLTRRAMNKRIELCFYNWRLEAQARTVVEYHGSEGEVRKR